MAPRRAARSARACLGALLVLISLFATLVAMPPLLAQDAMPAADGATAQPAEVKALLDLLAKPEMRAWLEQASAAPAATAPTASPAAVAPGLADGEAEMVLEARLMRLRGHLHSLVAAVPTMPGVLASAGGRLWEEMQGIGLIGTLLLIAGFVLLGVGTEWLFWRNTKWARSAIVEREVETVGDRLRAMAIRLAYGLSWVTSFALGSFGAFLLLDFPPRLRAVLLGALLVVLAIRVTIIVGRFLLSPGAEKFRIVPMTTEAARFWHKRLVLFVGTFVFGWVTIALVLRTLGVAPPHLSLIAYALGLAPLIVALETIWRRLEARHDSGERKILTPLAASIVLVVIWLTWVVGAMPSFWLLVVLFFTPLAIGITRRSILHLLRPVTSDDGAQLAKPSAWSVLIERIARAVLILGAVLILAWAWDIDFQAMAAQDTTATRLTRGVLNAVIILLVADLIWQVVKTTIDERMEDATQQPGTPGTEEARKKARLRTLLPIARNILFITFAAMAVLMALSSLGIEVGPLIAGAGVVGVAIGFGAQTLVKDVISGVFYLLDDAFRVGEYIQAGSYKGTVESFSLRSVKLRHHRGPLYTVPFGELGAIQNMSRDWVIDVLRVSVTYDTDLDKVKRIIKEIGKQLQADPEFAPSILQTLKMQGVDQFGDFAINIRLKMMTKPGEQFTIRRRAYALIKKAFAENGIEFAFPTVTVAGGENKDVSPAVLKQAVEMTRPAAAG